MICPDRQLRAEHCGFARARVGIIAGSGPEAGIDLWSKILTEARKLLGSEFRGDLDAPEVVVLSNPRLGLSMEMARHEARVRSELLGAIKAIDGLSDCFAIACNTLHHFAPEIERLTLRSKFFSIVEAAAQYLRTNGFTQIALLGSKGVMTLGPESPYQLLRDQFQCERVSDSDAVHALIYEIKRLGDVQATRDRFAQILATLRSPVVVLACTELPLVAEAASGKILVDPTAVLAGQLTRWAYQRDCSKQ
jgi:aspartate racemase